MKKIKIFIENQQFCVLYDDVNIVDVVDENNVSVLNHKKIIYVFRSIGHFTKNEKEIFILKCNEIDHNKIKMTYVFLDDDDDVFETIVDKQDLFEIKDIKYVVFSIENKNLAVNVLRARRALFDCYGNLVRCGLSVELEHKRVLWFDSLSKSEAFHVV